MTELQLILLISAVVFVGGLYWWGKRSKPVTMRRPLVSEQLPADTPEAEGFDVIVKPAVAQVLKEETAEHYVANTASLNEDVSPEAHPVLQDQPAVLPQITIEQEEHVISDRMSEYVTPIAPESVMAVSSTTEVVEVPSQLFALLVIDPTRQFNRKDIHQAMLAAGLLFSQQGIYVFNDASGNGIFRVANVEEPGYFPQVDDVLFSTLGVALVLELPAVVTPYRAMNEFITAARKISQNLGGRLYDAQRQPIKETHLKEMREYAQSITY